MMDYEQPAWRVYPNPATSKATLELERSPRETRVVVRDALGREVLRQRVSDYYTTLDLAALGSGVYHLELLASGKRMGAQRLVVQR